MQITSIEEIKKFAEEYSKSGKKWHFHILTPGCQLNNSKNYALIIENGTDNIAHVCYSDAPYMDIGKQLVQLLHGKEVIKDKEDKLEPPSTNIVKLLEKAKKLNAQGKFWHHHMLFPYCMFNKNINKWTIVFEDKDNNEIIESISDDEPKNDLKHIEALFYSQKK